MTKNIDPKAVKKVVDKAVQDAATGRTFNVAVAIESLGKLAIALAEAVADLQANQAVRPSAETVIKALKDKGELEVEVEGLKGTEAELQAVKDAIGPDAVIAAPKKTRKGKTVLKG